MEPVYLEYLTNSWFFSRLRDRTNECIGPHRLQAETTSSTLKSITTIRETQFAKIFAHMKNAYFRCFQHPERFWTQDSAENLRSIIDDKNIVL
jgi:hypothetical protein